MTEKGFMIGDTAVDYLTVTSTIHYEVLRSIAKDAMDFSFWGTPYLAKRMQFRGITDGSSFYGETDKGRKIAMYQTSGFESMHMYHQFCDYDRSLFKCTRLDVQITVEYDSDMRDLFALLVEKKGTYRDSTGKSLKWSMFNNDSGLDTLYIGSRVSEVFRRIYVKEIDGTLYLRFEIEYKGKRANKVFQNKVGYRTLQTALLDGLYFLVNSDCQDMFDQIKERVNCDCQGTLISLPEKNAVNVVWIKDVVIPYLLKAYDIHPVWTRDIIKALYDRVEYGITDNYEAILDSIPDLLYDS